MEICIPSHIIASLSAFVGEPHNQLDKIHVKVRSGRGFVEALNGSSFARHDIALDEWTHDVDLLIEPSADLVKACKAKNSTALVIADNLEMKVFAGQVPVYIAPFVAKKCAENEYPNCDQFIEKMEKNFSPDIPKCAQIAFPASMFDILKSAFGKKACYRFKFLGEFELAQVEVIGTDFVCIVAPMKGA